MTENPEKKAPSAYEQLISIGTAFEGHVIRVPTEEARQQVMKILEQDLQTAYQIKGLSKEEDPRKQLAQFLAEKKIQIKTEEQIKREEDLEEEEEEEEEPL